LLRLICDFERNLL
jgi:hypothetical protein